MQIPKSAGKAAGQGLFEWRSYSLSDVDFCSVCFFDTGSCGKCVGADGKELQAGRYEPGIGMCICRISERITGKL